MIKCPVHLEKTVFIVKCSRGKTDDSKYQFRHLILQEFLCSLYLCVTKNISPFLSNRELSSCTPTIHGIHRMVREAQNELFLKFYHALKISHRANYASLLLPITKYWKNKSFSDFIAKTNKLIEIEVAEILESMIEDDMLKIDEQNFDCVQFLNIFKETNNHPMNTKSIKSVEIKLISYNDYKNILNFLEHLDIESITFFSKINRDDEISNDLLKLCQMVTGKDILYHAVLISMSRQ